MSFTGYFAREPLVSFWSASPLKRWCLFFSRALPATRRLEGLAGLSVQDAELRLFQEKNTADTHSGGVHQSSSSSARSNADDGAPPDTTAVAPPTSDQGGKKRKKKRAKKQPAVTQRGPLLITHTGEDISRCMVSCQFREEIYVCVRTPIVVLSRRRARSVHLWLSP